MSSTWFELPRVKLFRNELKGNKLYFKGLIYYRPIFRLTKLAFFRDRTIPEEKIGIVLALRRANFVSRNIGL